MCLRTRFSQPKEISTNELAKQFDRRRRSNRWTSILTSITEKDIEMKINHLKISLQIIFNEAHTRAGVPRNALCSHIAGKPLIAQLQHLEGNIGAYVSDDAFVDPERLEIIRDCLYDLCAVLAASGKNPVLHAQTCELIREVNMVRIRTRDPSSV
jgi:hypothetical protein